MSIFLCLSQILLLWKVVTSGFNWRLFHSCVKLSVMVNRDPPSACGFIQDISGQQSVSYGCAARRVCEVCTVETEQPADVVVFISLWLLWLCYECIKTCRYVFVCLMEGGCCGKLPLFFLPVGLSYSLRAERQQWTGWSVRLCRDVASFCRVMQRCGCVSCALQYKRCEPIRKWSFISLLHHFDSDYAASSLHSLSNSLK